MQDDDRTEHLRVYAEMVEFYRHLGQPQKAEKYLRMIGVVENCRPSDTTIMRVDRQITRSKDVELYCKPKVSRRLKKTD